MKPFKEVYDCDSVTINVTNECNLECSYCFEENKTKTYMTKETAIKIVDDSYNLLQKDIGRFTINLFGGEPFLNWEVIKAIVDHCNQKDYVVRYGVTTNLTILTEEMLEYIDDNNIMLLVSIDGVKSVHDENRCGSYDRVISNIKKVIDRGLAHLIEARMTILPKDVNYVLEGIKELIDLGINNICPMPVTDTEWTDEQVKQYGEMYESILEYYVSILNDKNNDRNIAIKNTDEIMCNVLDPDISDTTMCPIGSNKWCSFDTNGDVYPCHQCPTSNNESIKKMLIGNVYDGVDEKMIVKDHVKSKFQREECLECEGKSICKSGCPAQNIRESGVYDKPTKAHCDLAVVEVQVAKKFRFKIIEAENIRGRMLNLLKENLKLKKYLDEEVSETNIHSMDFMIKLQHFKEMHKQLEGKIFPSFGDYFRIKIAIIMSYVLAKRGVEYGKQG